MEIKTQNGKRIEVFDNTTHSCLKIKPAITFSDNGKLVTNIKPKDNPQELTWREKRKLSQIKQLRDIVGIALREHKQWYHPRTHDLMITSGLTKTVSRNDSSCGIATRQPIRPKEKPSVSYNRRTNQPRGRIIKRIGKRIVFGKVIMGRPTGQYKTVWYSKFSRRK